MSKSSPSNTKLPTPLVSTEWLAEHLHDQGLRILDCSVIMQFRDDGSYFFTSGRDNWEQAHIPDSQFVDVLEELSDPDSPVELMMPPVDDFAKIMEGHGIGDDTRVILYDSFNHAWAARVWWMLQTCGFDDAAVLNGGWQKWTAENRETTSEVTNYPRGNLTIIHRPELMLTKDQMRESLDDDSITIINALPPDLFSGKVNVYSRPGRIPGSKNVFCQFLINPETQTYLDSKELEKLFQPTGALDADRVITYCGGGIAASSDALALTLLGVKNVAVYDGSLSEWTADSELPMETD